MLKNGDTHSEHRTNQQGKVIPQLLAADHVVLFVTDYGEPVMSEFVASKVKKYMEIAGIEKPGAEHLLCHASATHVLEGEADIRFLQEMLGHSSLDTTQIYTHVAIEKLQVIHEATHPEGNSVPYSRYEQRPGGRFY